ncbi:hypothetical protein TOPH_01607 [Tolypocladium ophioglossoides CBS 100239]|uniref:Uncharacterized protein n=1 Tax=Tolypocladium ophioglossoides (strain CBS 100239) TaxID=1163406 RepID=A0A0L0NHV0_TOLOC|nr:hypothetical protein TOPH_01607 [Tolypocladium ophioglossoides CBS 100239]
MVFSTTGTMEATSTTASPVRGVWLRCLRIASAPLLSPMPQSPSPTTVSNLVTSGSAAMTLSSASVNTAAAAPGSIFSPLGFTSRLVPASSVRVAVLRASQVIFWIGVAQPVTSLGASSSSTMPGPPTSVLTTLSSDTLKPSPLRLVMKVPLRMRTGWMPYLLPSWDTTSLVMPPSSSTLTPPRLLMSRTTSLELTLRNARSASLASSSCASILPTSCGRSICPRPEPGSLWMPMPISTAPGASLSSAASAARPGTWTCSRLAPTLTRFTAARRATLATSSSGRPMAASAPAIFSTSTVPAMPRLPTLPALALPTPTSFPTTTISTAWPAARAFSTAMPKLSTSPV